MTIYYQPDKTSILMHVKPTDRWYMIADYDAGGSAHLFLNVNGVEAPLLSGTDFRKVHPGCTNRQILELYNAMIREVFRRIKAGLECIDLAEIEKELLEGLKEKREE